MITTDDIGKRVVLFFPTTELTSKEQDTAVVHSVYEGYVSLLTQSTGLLVGKTDGTIPLWGKKNGSLGLIYGSFRLVEMS